MYGHTSKWCKRVICTTVPYMGHVGLPIAKPELFISRSYEHLGLKLEKDLVKDAIDKIVYVMLRFVHKQKGYKNLYMHN